MADIDYIDLTKKDPIIIDLTCQKEKLLVDLAHTQEKIVHREEQALQAQIDHPERQHRHHIHARRFPNFKGRGLGELVTLAPATFATKSEASLLYFDLVPHLRWRLDASMPLAKSISMRFIACLSLLITNRELSCQPPWRHRFFSHLFYILNLKRRMTKRSSAPSISWSILLNILIAIVTCIISLPCSCSPPDSYIIPRRVCSILSVARVVLKANGCQFCVDRASWLMATSSHFQNPSPWETTSPMYLLPDRCSFNPLDMLCVTISFVIKFWLPEWISKGIFPAIWLYRS